MDTSKPGERIVIMAFGTVIRSRSDENGSVIDVRFDNSSVISTIDVTLVDKVG
jgi:hypothetical protein